MVVGAQLLPESCHLRTFLHTGPLPTLSPALPVLILTCQAVCATVPPPHVLGNLFSYHVTWIGSEMGHPAVKAEPRRCFGGSERVRV